MKLGALRKYFFYGNLYVNHLGYMKGFLILLFGGNRYEMMFHLEVHTESLFALYLHTEVHTELQFAHTGLFTLYLHTEIHTELVFL